MGSHEIRVSERASRIEYAIRDVVVPATKLEEQGHEIIKLNIILILGVIFFGLGSISKILGISKNIKSIYTYR